VLHGAEIWKGKGKGMGLDQEKSLACCLHGSYNCLCLCIGMRSLLYSTLLIPLLGFGVICVFSCGCESREFIIKLEEVDDGT
jgi:hypothetical protein